MNYLASLLGSILFGFIRLKIEKQISDDTGKKINWKKYFEKEWDDFVFSVIVGQGLCFIQESLFFSFAKWQEWEDKKAIDFYYDGEETIAFAMGLFGSLLILILFKYVIKKASKLSE